MHFNVNLNESDLRETSKNVFREVKIFLRGWLHGWWYRRIS